MKEFLETHYTVLKEELDIIADLGISPVRRLVVALNAIKEAIDQIKANLNDYPFKSQAEEIDFFKDEKPRFVSEQLYALEIFSIETNRPLGDIQLLKGYYELELQFIKRFFTQYQFLYQYYTHELKELDHLLFVIGAKPSDIILPETAGLDPYFSTSCDSLFAKFIAYERLQVYILQELKSLENTGKPLNADSKESSIELKWTGETINLAELAYGIWLTGQINNGNATITDIILWLEGHLQVIIGTAHRRWVSIAKRKRVSQVKYLDQVRDALLKRLEEENGK